MNEEHCQFCGEKIIYTSCGYSLKCNNGYTPDCPTAQEADSLDCFNIHNGEPCMFLGSHCGCS